MLFAIKKTIAVLVHFRTRCFIFRVKHWAVLSTIMLITLWVIIRILLGGMPNPYLISHILDWSNEIDYPVCSTGDVHEKKLIATSGRPGPLYIHDDQAMIAANQRADSARQALSTAKKEAYSAYKAQLTAGQQRGGGGAQAAAAVQPRVDESRRVLAIAQREMEDATQARDFLRASQPAATKRARRPW
jgi:hypothetical protein